MRNYSVLNRGAACDIRPNCSKIRQKCFYTAGSQLFLGSSQIIIDYLVLNYILIQNGDNHLTISDFVNDIVICVADQSDNRASVFKYLGDFKCDTILLDTRDKIDRSGTDCKSKKNCRGDN